MFYSVIKFRGTGHNVFVVHFKVCVCVCVCVCEHLARMR